MKGFELSNLLFCHNVSDSECNFASANNSVQYNTAKTGSRNDLISAYNRSRICFTPIGYRPNTPTQSTQLNSNAPVSIGSCSNIQAVVVTGYIVAFRP